MTAVDIFILALLLLLCTLSIWSWSLESARPHTTVLYAGSTWPILSLLESLIGGSEILHSVYKKVSYGSAQRGLD